MPGTCTSMPNFAEPFTLAGTSLRPISLRPISLNCDGFLRSASDTFGGSAGTVANATYEIVKRGDSGHAEAVKVIFDPRRISFEQLLGWFFRMHDPTTKNRQGNDIGTSYRSAIFTTSAAQQKTAAEVQARVDQSGKWKNPVVTEIVAAGDFWSAEDYHQDYLVKNPGGYTCHYLRD